MGKVYRQLTVQAWLVVLLNLTSGPLVSKCMKQFRNDYVLDCFAYLIPQLTQVICLVALHAIMLGTLSEQHASRSMHASPSGHTTRFVRWEKRQVASLRTQPDG